MTDTSKSNSIEQQNAEIFMTVTVEEWLGRPVGRKSKW